ncbi:MAG: 16S rRNA methyltransferase, partial [Rhodobacteraceae bacterium]|nr:16S rRNA methyltransferase [Paracoccaceae bacterium]
MADTDLGARRSAIYLLDQVLGEKRLMSESLGAGVLDRLAPQDRARAQRLATQTLRGLERADRLLHKHLRKKPPLTVHNALRLGTVELCHGEAAHGVVNAMVQIISANKRDGRLKGLVNAVLRKIA